VILPVSHFSPVAAVTLIRARSAQVAGVRVEYRGLDCVPYPLPGLRGPPAVIVLNCDRAADQFGLGCLQEVLASVLKFIRVIPEVRRGQAVGDQLHAIHVPVGFSRCGLVIHQQPGTLLFCHEPLRLTDPESDAYFCAFAFCKFDRTIDLSCEICHKLQTQ
jgi:hypothetical protein